MDPQPWLFLVWVKEHYILTDYKTSSMIRILVLISLSDKGIETIKANPDLPRAEMEFINRWKEDTILESFYISITRKEAVLLFQHIDEQKAMELIAGLPYFPYMEKVDYHILNKQF